MHEYMITGQQGRQRGQCKLYIECRTVRVRHTSEFQDRPGGASDVKKEVLKSVWSKPAHGEVEGRGMQAPPMTFLPRVKWRRGRLANRRHDAAAPSASLNLKAFGDGRGGSARRSGTPRGVHDRRARWLRRIVATPVFPERPHSPVLLREPDEQAKKGHEQHTEGAEPQGGAHDHHDRNQQQELRT